MSAECNIYAAVVRDVTQSVGYDLALALICSSLSIAFSH